METSKIPTAEEFLRSKYKLEGDKGTLRIDQLAMILNDYALLKAKFYVTAALEAAAEKALVDKEYAYQQDWCVDKQSILNAYPLDNIK